MALNIAAWAWFDWLSCVGFLVLLASYLTTDMGKLRKLAGPGLGLLAVAAFAGALQSVWLTAFWFALLAVANLVRMLTKPPTGANAALSIEEEALRSWLFPTMTPADFVKLLRAGQRSVIGSGSQFTSRSAALT